MKNSPSFCFYIGVLSGLELGVKPVPLHKYFFGFGNVDKQVHHISFKPEPEEAMRKEVLNYTKSDSPGSNQPKNQWICACCLSRVLGKVVGAWFDLYVTLNHKLRWTL